MTRPGEPLFGWPGWKHLRFAALLTVLGFGWFVAIFSATNDFTGWHGVRVRVHLDAELALPFIPGAVVVYLSIYLLLAAAPFVLRQRRPLLALAVALNTATLLAGFCFLLIPAQLAFPPPADPGPFPGLFAFADRLNLTYNLVPSLHVAFSVLCVAAFAGRATIAGRALLWAWASAVAASTLLTHQHHIVDVIAGWALGVFSFRRIFCPRAAPTNASGS